jgi:hypothetical protein
METVGWQRMVAGHPRLVNEAFRALASRTSPMGPPGNIVLK